jgi:hypothetical protein
VSDRSPAAATLAKLVYAGRDNYVRCPGNSADVDHLILYLLEVM